MKTVTMNAADAAQLLLDSGLLGEINRVILVPRGLALAVKVTDTDPDKAVGFGGLVDCRDDPAELVIDDELRREIAAKLAAYDAEHPLKNITEGVKDSAEGVTKLTARIPYQG